MADPLLPYGRHLIDDDDIAAVNAALRSDWLTTGPVVEAFEQAFATRVGAPHAVACANGTAALHLAALALGLGPGDKVIVPSLSFLASANGPHYTGAEIVFADVHPDTGLLTAETLTEALARCGGKASAVVVVHLNGQCADLPALASIARGHGLAVIEDACHALGSRFRHPPNQELLRVGACDYSDIACFSFHPVKTIAMGEGGALTTRSPQLASALRRLRSHGIIREPGDFAHPEQAFDDEARPNPWYYEMHQPGFNYRASDLQCALGLSQLTKLDVFCERRRALTLAYDRRFSTWPSWARAVPRVADCDPVLHLYVLLIEFARSKAGSRAAAMRSLKELGIGTQVHYIPIHRQPYYRALTGLWDLKGADAYYERCLSIPLFPGMRDTDVDRVADALASVLLP